MTFDQWLKVLGLIGGISSFLWGVYVWRDKATEDLRARAAEQQRLSDTRRVEATKPFLEKQLYLYSEATRAAARVATQAQFDASLTGDAGKVALSDFWQLYWGELAMVENPAVESAMVRMGTAIQSKASPLELQQASLAIAHACRESLDKSWGINAWAKPDEAAARSAVA